ncbi:MAG: hypothetical protein KGH98_02630 [Candidatus Micrarchaeota archaeon]|nr:hypothetical protein [Candidatus Micrarchaeota archaeon]
MAKRIQGKSLYVLLLVVSTLLGAVGQLFFKYGLNTGDLLIWIVSGVAAYFISTGIYFVVLSRAHLSWTYGIGGLSYIFTVIFSYFVLMENVPLLRWAGVIVITAGVVLIGLS